MAGDESTTAYATGAGGTELEPALAAPFLAGLAAWPLRLDVPMAVGGTLDDAATSMNLKPSEQEGPS